MPMKCFYCGSDNTEVIDSREVQGGEGIRRRRECIYCKRRFTTYEKADLADITVIKKDGTRQPFDSSKILNGIMRACEKRTITRATMETTVGKIEKKIRSKGLKEISSREIGDMVIRELYKLDPVAYIRFASVYKNFGSPEEFEKVLKLFAGRIHTKGNKPKPRSTST